jgi:hypothetical protein
MISNNEGISLDQPLAHGRTADVYLWDDTHVLKLFHKWFDLESIEYEFKIARTVHTSGIKTPAALELIQVEGRNGLLYERPRARPCWQCSNADQTGINTI